jgi:hypothetical protein
MDVDELRKTTAQFLNKPLAKNLNKRNIKNTIDYLDGKSRSVVIGSHYFYY